MLGVLGRKGLTGALADIKANEYIDKARNKKEKKDKDDWQWKHAGYSNWLGQDPYALFDDTAIYSYEPFSSKKIKDRRNKEE